VFRYTPTIEGVEIEPVTGLVAPHMVSEEVELTFTTLLPEAHLWASVTACLEAHDRVVTEMAAELEKPA